MIMNIVIAFFVIKAILFVFEIALYLLQAPRGMSECLKHEIENNLVRIAKENKEIADMHARSRKYFEESQAKLLVR